MFFCTAVLFSVPHAEVRMIEGHPALFIKGNAVPPFAYMSYFGETRHYREIAAAGIHLYCFPAYLGDRGINSASGIGPFRPPIMPEENRLDYSSIREDFRKILEADPRAMVIIRVHLDVPGWWDMKYPGESSLQADGTLERQSFSSPIWREHAGENLRSLVSWLLSSSYAEHLAGIHVAAGFTEEWFYHFSETFADRSPARRNAFRKWLKEEYRYDPSLLRKAWGDERVTFENAETADISGSVRNPVWRDPSREPEVMDAFRFHARTMADNIAFFCGIVKQSSGGRLLTGAFYGYHFYVTDSRRGHGALARLLECPDLDYLSSPNVYKREMGEDWAPMAAVQSVLLHGKLWMAENDTRTSLTTLLKDSRPEICPPGQYESAVWLGPPALESSAALLWANSARMLSYGYGGWWFDMWGGWFSDPMLLGVLETTNSLYGTASAPLVEEMSPHVCVLADEELHFLDAGFGAMTEKTLKNRYSLGKTGAPYDLYLRDDLEILPSSSYRVIWLMGFPTLTSGESARMRGWLESGKMVVWTDLKGTHIHRSPEKHAFHPGRFSWSAGELRSLWREAGVHLYLETDDICYAGRGWLGIHTVSGGKKGISLPFRARITDPLTGAVIAESDEFFEISIKPRSTRLFKVDFPGLE